ncbi:MULTISPECIES: hypothetical protein [Leucobacter]|uniref:hypothetical protein n=1 Tax=Leucobacter TaxID=55968 RepID=UPI0006A7AF46|nr:MULTISPECIES: hypothetical protein [Leucobacter]
MARVEVHPDRVIIRLTASEKIAAMRRRDIELDRTAITSAIVTDDPWVWVRGVRAPGASLPGTLAAGTWRNFTGRDFVLARRGRKAVVIDFETPEGADEDHGWHGEFDHFSRVIVSTVHAGELIQALRLDGGATAVDAGA